MEVRGGDAAAAAVTTDAADAADATDAGSDAVDAGSDAAAAAAAADHSVGKFKAQNVFEVGEKTHLCLV